MDNREDIPPPTIAVLTPEEHERLMDSNKMLVELMEREARAVELKAEVEEAKTKFNDCLNTVYKETNITLREVFDVECLKIFVTERPDWTGTVTIDAANDRDQIQQQVRLILASIPEGQIQINFV